jgi:TonB family protein
MKLQACAFPVLAVLWLTAGTAMAQSVPPSPASLPASSPADRALRDADKVYRMILMHADKPRRAARDERSGATPAPAAAGTPSPPAAPAPAVATMNAEAAARLALPSRTDVELPVAAVPAAVIAPQVLPTMRTVPALAAMPVAEPASATRAPAPLELLTSVEPDFPQRLLRSIGPGSVVVEFDVAPDGSVARTAVARSPHRGLNAAALAAVSAWRFKPPGTTMPGVAELKFE